MQGSHRPGSAEQSSTWGDPAAGWLAPGGMFGSCGGLRSAGSAASSCAGAAAGLEHCLSGDKENLVMRPHDEVLGTAARSEREAQIISEAARFREEQPGMQPGADDMSAAGMTPREKGQHTIPHRLLREASMEMIKVRRQEHAKCEAILHRLDSEIAADTEFLRRSLLSVSEKSKAQLLADLRGKVEISKRHKQRLRDLERDIADLNVTKRMGVAPFHTPESDRQPHLTPRLNTARSASSAQSTSASERRHLTARPPSAERWLHEKSHSAHGEVAGGYRL